MSSPGARWRETLTRWFGSQVAAGGGFEHCPSQGSLPRLCHLQPPSLCFPNKEASPLLGHFPCYPHPITTLSTSSIPSQPSRPPRSRAGGPFLLWILPSFTRVPRALKTQPEWLASKKTWFLLPWGLVGLCLHTSRGLRGNTGIPLSECCEKIKFHIQLAWPWIPFSKPGCPGASGSGACPRFCLLRQRKGPIGRSLPSCCCGFWPKARRGSLGHVASSPIHSWAPGTWHTAWPLLLGGPVSKEQCCYNSGVEFLGAEKALLPPQCPLLGWAGLAPGHCRPQYFTPRPHLRQLQFQSYLALLVPAQAHTQRHAHALTNILCMPTRTNIHMHTHTHTRMWICVYILMHTTHTWVYVHTYIHLHTCMHTRMHVYTLLVCVYCIYNTHRCTHAASQKHKYEHTHMHRDTNARACIHMA